MLSSSNITLDHIAVSSTFGDGLELVADLGHTAQPDTNLTVNGYTTDGTGRQGMTIAEVEGGYFRQCAHRGAGRFRVRLRIRYTAPRSGKTFE